MAKLTRYLQKIFANNSNQVGVFGTGVDKETSKNVETLQSADYENGWSSAIITNKNYPIWQERDGVDYGFSYQLAYLMQAGMPEWLSTETYYTNSFCRYGAKMYYSLQDNNTNHNPALNDGYWTEFSSGASRNIGEIVTSTIPLTDAGLHLLDGALLQYGSYSSFVDYIADLYNDTKVYNPSAFTVVGSPTITDDGIASGFSGSNYLQSVTTLNLTQPYRFHIKCKTPASWSSEYEALTGNSLIAIRNSNGVWNVDLGSISITTTHTIALNTEYSLDVIYNGTNYSLYSNGSLLGTTTGTPSRTSGVATYGYFSSAYPRAWGGTIDLKETYFIQNGVEVFSGAKTDWSCLESEWQQSITDYGVCDKFVYNSANNTVRLPKYGSQIWTGGGDAPVVGNGMTIGYTDGSSNYGQTVNDNTENRWAFRTAAYGLTLPASTGNSGNMPNAGADLGLTTDGTKSGIITDLANITTAMDCYYYIVIATSTKTDIQVDIDEIAADLANKLDKDGSNVGSTLSNIFLAKLTPDYANGITQTSTGTTAITYTCPSVGFVNYSTTIMGISNSAYVKVNNVIVNRQDGKSVQVCQELTGGLIVNKGDVVEVIPNYASASSYLYFFPLKGV